jgi:hypothetical protein
MPARSQVKGWDPLVLAGSVVALAIAAFFASIIPAQRAASIDPAKALQAEWGCDVTGRRVAYTCI